MISWLHRDPLNTASWSINPSDLNYIKKKSPPPGELKPKKYNTKYNDNCVREHKYIFNNKTGQTLNLSNPTAQSLLTIFCLNHLSVERT